MFWLRNKKKIIVNEALIWKAGSISEITSFGYTQKMPFLS